MSAVAATAPATTPAAPTLASLYDVHDPVFEYQVQDAAPAAAVAPEQAKPANATPGVTPAPSVPPVAPAAPAPAPVAAPKHPERLLRYASELGIHPLIVDKFSTDDLNAFVMDQLATVRQTHQQNQTASTITNPVAAAATPAVPAEPPFDWGKHPVLDAEGRATAATRQYTEDEVHPVLAAHIKTLHGEIKGLKAELANMARAGAQSAEAQREKVFDAAFNKLGGVFGTGDAASLKGKPEWDRRATVYAAVKGMYAALPQAMRNTMPIEDAVFSIAKSMFNVPVPAPQAAPAAAAAQNGVPTPEAFRTGGTQPPTARRSNNDRPVGRDRAVHDATEWFKQQATEGNPVEAGGTQMDEFFH